MDTKHICRMLLKLGFRPSLKGFSTSAHLIGLACRRMEPMKDPSIKELYAETAACFGVSPRNVSDNLKTMLDAYCSQSANLEHFHRLTGYRTEDRLTNKEFVFLLARCLQGRRV